MSEAERCTDVTNTVVGNADGAPCWRSEHQRLARAWRGEVLGSYCADVIDERLAAGVGDSFFEFLI
jgi:hypothetical protein